MSTLFDLKWPDSDPDRAYLRLDRKQWEHLQRLLQERKAEVGKGLFECAAASEELAKKPDKEIAELLMKHVWANMSMLDATGELVSSAIDRLRRSNGGRMASNNEYEELLAKVKKLMDEGKIPPDQMPGSREQMVSFAYGNCALSNPLVTKQLVEEAVDEYLATKKSITETCTCQIVRVMDNTPVERVGSPLCSVHGEKR